MDELVELCDDFALQGGPDVDPARFGDTTPYDKAPLCPERDAFELPLVQKILATDKPLFTTCRGTQLLNVALGGTLCMDVPSRTPRPGMQLWRHTEHPCCLLHALTARDVLPQELLCLRHVWRHDRSQAEEREECILCALLEK